MYNGLINVYKEPGFTSMDVVAVLRGILKQKKIGHTGTLDPQAEGVLMVCLGNATKLCTFLEDKDKEYVCRMLLGTTTDTEDTTGNIVSNVSVDDLSNEDVESAIKSFVGDIKQVPPMYSALKKDGKKLYELARQGIEIEREAREIKIYDIEIMEIAMPYVTFLVKCSKGTYVRSLCRDIGEKLGVGACMDHLTRTAVSFFTIDNALKLSDIERLAKEDKIDELILETSEVFKDKKALHVLPEYAKFIDNGNPLQKEYVRLEDSEKNTDKNLYDNKFIKEDNLFRVYNTSGQFVAVYSYDETRDIYMPSKMFM
ncbi:MAG: tRNA pseudouridine(55) synthase TruB [Lachnospiraceae bacterium]|nr:tRNA pseudouridine(55) synthase TruB [Lachnospiraceae bacterium]